MIKFFHYLRLIRPLNLAMIAIFMWVMYEFVLVHFYVPSGTEASDFHYEVFNLSGFGILLLILATTLIAAGGNAINDCYDIEADRINKPGDVVVNDTIPKSTARLYAFLLFAAGNAAGLVIGYLSSQWTYALIFPISTALLFLYSLFLQRIPIVGNLVISLLAGLTPLLVYLFVAPTVTIYGSSRHGIEFNSILFQTFACFAAFAFAVTFIREIIKDLADREGDRAVSMKTLPILIGEKGTKVFVTILFLLVLGSLYYLVEHFYDRRPMLLHFEFYLGLTVGLPLLVASIRTWLSKERKHYISVGNNIKFAMFMAMLFPIFATLIIKFFT